MSAVSNYGTEESGFLSNIPTNAPPGLTYYAIDVGKHYVSNGDGTWREVTLEAAAAYHGLQITLGTLSGDDQPVNIQAVDAAGDPVAAAVAFDFIVTDAGGSPAEVAPSGGSAVTTGTEDAVVTAGIHLQVTTDASGAAVVTITEAGTKTYTPVAVAENGNKTVGPAINFS